MFVAPNFAFLLQRWVEKVTGLDPFSSRLVIVMVGIAWVVLIAVAYLIRCITAR